MLAPPLILTLRPSRWLALAMVITHLAATISVWIAALDWRLRATLLVALAVSLAWQLRPRAPLTVRGHADGTLEIRNGDDWLPIHILADSTVWPWLAVIRYRAEAGPNRAIAVFPDSLDRDAFRQLRVWLRWRAMPDNPTSPTNAA